eukprot:533388_1
MSHKRYHVTQNLMDDELTKLDHTSHEFQIRPLHTIYNIRSFHQPPNNDDCDLNDCKCMKRTSFVLQRYHTFIKSLETHECYKNSSEQTCELQELTELNQLMHHPQFNIQLLNDYNHLLSVHSHEFEDIHNILITKSNSRLECDLSNCCFLKRNYRNRNKTHFDRKMYFDQDEKNIIQQQLFDRIHSYYFHSFDIGHKMTRNELRNISDYNELKEDNTQYDNPTQYDISRLNDLMKSKQQVYRDIDGFDRLKSEHNKFTTPTPMKQQIVNEFSFGFRYFYWDYYKNNLKTTDDADKWCGGIYGGKNTANGTSTCSKWYIIPKYDSLKQELTSNPICKISNDQWNIELGKAESHVETDTARKMSCARKETAAIYGMKFEATITTQHLLAMMVYCNFDMLQFKFSETFRHITKEEEDEDMQKRHKNYCFLGKLLRECVECFGMKWTNESSNLRLYHGVSKTFTF